MTVLRLCCSWTGIILKNNNFNNQLMFYLSNFLFIYFLNLSNYFAKYRFGSRCNYCFASTDVKRCSKCHFYGYCGRLCQKNDWNLHKKECRHLSSTSVISHLESVGSSLVSSRGLNVADFLLVARICWLLVSATPNTNAETIIQKQVRLPSG